MASSKFTSRTTLVYMLVIPLVYVLFNFTMKSQPPREIQIKDPVLKELITLWKADFKKLNQSGELDKKVWSQIKRINYEYSSALSKSWRDRFTSPIKTNHKGHYELDILFMTWTEDGQIGVIAQFDVMNIKDKNLVLEISRTYYLNSPK